MSILTRRSIPIALATVFLVASTVVPAFALPVLQMFIEGARFDKDAETWYTSSNNFKLWVVGNTANGPIEDVQLAAAFLSGETGNISVNASTTSLLPDFSTPDSPILNTAVGADGTVPIKSDGMTLGSRGIYGSGVSFNQWDLGDMTLQDSPVGNFNGSTIPPGLPNTGQINVYDISITGYSVVHFDIFNHVEGHKQAFFGPFSGATAIPEPASILLVGLGLMGGLGGTLRRRIRRSRS